MTTADPAARRMAPISQADAEREDARTAAQAAAILGVTTRTLYRWANDGVIPRDWWTADLLPYAGLRLPKGPPRNPRAVRYTTGRHRFNEQRGRHPALLSVTASASEEPQ